MANPEHLALLRFGLAEWNDWREQGPESPDLSEAALRGQTLQKANLSWANLSRADLSGANLSGANLSKADPSVVVDNLEVAQFIHLLLHNKNIRAVIDTVTSKVVLILGRFTAERKEILDALRTARYGSVGTHRCCSTLRSPPVEISRKQLGRLRGWRGS